MSDAKEIKEKLEYYEEQKENVLAAFNSLKGQKSVLESQKQELLAELEKVGCKNSKELDAKILALETEINEFKIEIPDELCNLI